ncbi:hypothetical protein [Desulforamulus profundi]|uniref:hypothetical protein n=1 Tax=Desulforamulus profundi TaxID=1383067 RepID=UPI0015D51E80|nr:hypothetical protein [Desulforamulus profundi]
MVSGANLSTVGADTANAPPYGLLGNFNGEGCLTTMECRGASLDDAQEPLKGPKNILIPALSAVLGISVGNP